MTTPPTPAEVAEARAWFEKRNTLGLVSLDSGPVGDATLRHAAVLVRAALAAPAGPDAAADEALGRLARMAASSSGLHTTDDVRDQYVIVRAALAETTRGSGAAPAEQPREDHPDIGTVFRELRDVSGMRWQLEGVDPDDVTSFSAAEVLHMLDAARSVSPSAVPAEHLNRIARPTAPRSSDASIVDEVCDELGIERNEVVETMHRYHLLNMAFDECVRTEVARRLVDTGTQATEQTTEYRAAIEGEQTGTYQDGLDEVREFVADRKARGQAYRVESRTVTTSVSPWSPVDVHENEQP